MTRPLLLHVNDKAYARYLMKKMLEGADCQLLEADSGYETLRMVRELQPSLVLLDVKLPDIDGIEVCRRLKLDPRTAAVRVLHTSATYRAQDVQERSRRAGAEAYLEQPFTRDELLAIITQVLQTPEPPET